MANPEPVTATITEGGRIRIPAEVLRHLRLRAGQQVVFFLKEGKDAAVVAPLATALSVPSF
jgi:AbrB family looped-hinge helix DNA binding protein